MAGDGNCNKMWTTVTLRIVEAQHECCFFLPFVLHYLYNNRKYKQSDLHLTTGSIHPSITQRGSTDPPGSKAVSHVNPGFIEHSHTGI